MTSIDATGFHRSRLDERLDDLKTRVRGIFGDDIDLDADTVDGQLIGIFAEAISNLDQLAEDVYHSFNPQSATGAAQSRLVQLNGIRRTAGAYSTVSLTVTGNEGTTIPAGSLVRTALGTTTFQTLDAVTIDSSGSATVAARATVMGAISAGANTLTKIQSPVYGWQTVTNPSAAVLGRAEETDEDLRARRTRSTATPAQTILDGIIGAIANITGVTQVEVYENDTDTVDANGQAPHSIYPVVVGGDQQTILDAIWRKKTSGTTLIGSVTGTVLDSLGNGHTMRFSRPTEKPIYVIVNLHMKPGWPTDGVARMQNAIVAWALANQKIGAAVIHSQLFNPVNSIPGISVDNIFIGTSPAPTGEIDIACAFDELATFDVSRIAVNPT